MKSLFPGMDPYLEAHWLDVHQRLCTYACDAINGQLASDLLAHMGERIVVESLFDKPRGIHPDVRIIEHGGLAMLPVTPSATTAAEPLVLDVEQEPLRQPYIEVIEVGTGKVITVIEFLSPTNKLPGDGMRQYRKKQRELFDAAVSFVEIDLVRRGDYVLLAPFDQIPAESRTPYKVSVFRGYRPAKVEYYALPLRKLLPGIRIPLRQTDPDAVLDLQALIDQAYANGRYGALIDYGKPCDPPLASDDARWAAGLGTAR